jgi:hypothetical protein
MSEFSTTSGYVFELKCERGPTDRFVAGLESGKLSNIEFLRSLVGLLARSVKFRLRRRR